MSSPAKFMFDIDFAAPKPSNAVPLAEHQVQVGEAESRGYRNGFSEGQREAEGQTARRLAIAMEDIARTLERLSHGLSTVEHSGSRPLPGSLAPSIVNSNSRCSVSNNATGVRQFCARPLPYQSM